jgi:hypothetical protein
MVALAAGSTMGGLARFVSRSTVGRHDVRQLVKTGLFALADTHSVVSADPDPPLCSVCATDSRSTHDGYRIGVSRKGSLEPRHLLYGMNVGRALAEIYRVVTG